uniref:Fatty acyl-CoA reductase n=1 Tax=Phallusia mammillata TaxID=59560 RepID=A0A6F9DBZ9_9ASCI|nr:fatty acyl-CoA reductase 1 [Phallusia mammillata]
MTLKKMSACGFEKKYKTSTTTKVKALFTEPCVAVWIILFFGDKSPEMATLEMSISQFFNDKTVAITGGTGFIGQCLIVKLLKSCPGVKKIYLFMRNKKSDSVEERLEKMIKSPIFKAFDRSLLQKLVAIPCDLEKEGFGLDEGNVQLIQDEVQIFFHSAATLRFNEHLRLAFQVNTLAVRTVIGLCRGIKNLKALVHISTAYAYCNQQHIGEEVYETGQDYNKLHESLQWMSDDMITKLTPDILRDRPNTYTLTKAFGEEVVVNEGAGLPLCIVRPSIVGSTYQEPLQGWINNVNGPTGLFLAVGKGFLCSIWGSGKTFVDIIPSDLVVNGIIAAAWKTALSNPQTQIPFLSNNQLKPLTDQVVAERRKMIPIYHLVVGSTNPLPIERLNSMLHKSFMVYPLDNVIRSPSLQITENKHLYRLLAFVYEYLPAYVFDLGLTMVGRKPMVMRLNQRIATNVKVLQFFISNQWNWDVTKTMHLMSQLNSSDQQSFNFDAQTINWQTYINRYVIGVKKYLLKEDLDSYPAQRRRLKRLHLLGYVGQGVLFLLVWRLLVSRTNIARNLWHLVMSLGFKFFQYFQISSSVPKSNFLRLPLWKS